MMGSMALPELMAATLAQLSQKMRTVVPVMVGSQSRAATNRFQHSRLVMENPYSWINLGKAPCNTAGQNRGSSWECWS